MPDEADIERYAEAAWKHRCDRMAEAKERPPESGTWAERAPFLREIDMSVVSLVAAAAVHDAELLDHGLRMENAWLRAREDEIRRAIKTYMAVNGKAARADDLAEAVRQILGREAS